MNPGAREGQAVSATYKTPAVLFIYIVNSDKGLVDDRGKKKNLCIKEKIHGHLPMNIS